MLEFCVTRSINVSQIVDLFEFESGEFLDGLRYFLDVEMAYYIVESVIRVLHDIFALYMRIWKCIKV